MGIYIAGFSFIAGFALIWHIMWLALVGLLGGIACIIIRLCDDDTDYHVTAAEIEQIEEGVAELRKQRDFERFSDERQKK